MILAKKRIKKIINRFDEWDIAYWDDSIATLALNVSFVETSRAYMQNQPQLQLTAQIPFPHNLQPSKSFIINGVCFVSSASGNDSTIFSFQCRTNFPLQKHIFDRIFRQKEVVGHPK
ncbi:hypothetical protein R6Q59_034358 [Mikania micrantha]